MANLFLDRWFGNGAGVRCYGWFSMSFASWWLYRVCGYRIPLWVLLRVLVPTAAAVPVVLLLSGRHVLLIVTAAAAAYLATSLGVGPVKWSTLTAMRAKKVMA